jgi:hypothetical protein
MRRDRGRLLTRALFVAGLLLLGIVVAAIAIRRGGHEQPTTSAATPTATATSRPAPTATAPAPPATTPATTAPPTTAPPSPVQITSVTPFSVTVAWHTDEPTTDRVAAALPGMPPTLWSGAVGPSVDHSATVGGLAFESDYVLTVDGTTLQVHTPQPTSSVIASTGGGSLLLDGQPFFPLLAWGPCPSDYDGLVAAGINLIASNPCGGAAAQVTALAGRALSASVAGEADAQDPGVIGWFFPDEADARRITARTLPAVPESSAVGRVSFLTLSNHVYSRSQPLAWGRSMYPGLIRKADVVGFDLYPLQSWCNPNALDDVYLAQAELVRLAGLKPTFQWIETQRMACDAPASAVTPETVRVESWLAVAGGAHGLGFFPFSWDAMVGSAVTDVMHTVKAIAPALLTPGLPISAAAGSPVRAAAHELNGAFYLVLANPSRRAVTARVSVRGLGTRNLTALDGSAALGSRGGIVRTRLGPLGSAVYVAAPRA